MMMMVVAKARGHRTQTILFPLGDVRGHTPVDVPASFTAIVAASSLGVVTSSVTSCEVDGPFT